MAHPIQRSTPARARRSQLHKMERIFVSHVFPAPRPHDWASVLALKAKVDERMQKCNLNWSEPRFGRLPFKGEPVYDTQKKHDRWDWNSPEVAIEIEGWASKE